MSAYFKTCVKAGLVSLLLFLPGPAAAAAKAPSPIEVRLHEFSNGLALYHVRVEEATKFKLSATVWVGSVDEDRKTNAGVSHLLEHILFHQRDMTEVEFKAQVESRGGSSNAETWKDFTRYYVTLPSSHLELGQRWLHKVLFHDRLVTDRLEEEKEIVNRENGWSAPTWWGRLWAIIDPDYLELPGFWERTFGLPKYDQYPGGKYRVASKLAVPELEAHYRAYYYPENMVLLYVGPHELEGVVPLVQATFGSVPPTGRKPNFRPVLENRSARTYFYHGLPAFLSDPEYQISIGEVFTGVRFSQDRELFFYRFVLRELLEERFRYAQGKVYSVSTNFDYHRGAGYVQFRLEGSPDTYWRQLKELKDVVWGNLAKHLSQKDYERYKTTFSEQVASMRDVDGVHGWIWRAIYMHPVHRPSSEQVTTSGPWQSFSYEDFRSWVHAWRGQTAPLLWLSMPVFPFPYAHLVLFVFAISIGVQFGRSRLRRPFPQENIKLITRIPYSILGWFQLGLFYAVVIFVYAHLSYTVSYSTLFFSRIDALAMAEPYLGKIVDGLLIGFVIVMGGFIMPRKVLVTDGALVLKMQSPLFFRIPLTAIERVERVKAWTAWKKIVSLKALPIYPWFLRGLLIHRKSGRPLVIHTTDDDKLRELLSSQVVIDAAMAAATANSPTETEALIGN